MDVFGFVHTEPTSYGIPRPAASVDDRQRQTPSARSFRRSANVLPPPSSRRRIYPAC